MEENRLLDIITAGLVNYILDGEGNGTTADHKWRVIVSCADGEVVIGKDGINEFPFETALDIMNDHKGMGGEVILQMVED